MESLWPKFEEQVIEKNDTIQILRVQARAIKSETKGIVNATFSKMHYKRAIFLPFLCDFFEDYSAGVRLANAARSRLLPQAGKSTVTS